MRFQLISWFPGWQGFGFYRWVNESSMRYIYDWHFYFAFWEIRKWHKLAQTQRIKMSESKRKMSEIKKQSPEEIIELLIRIEIAAGILTEGLYELNTTIKELREKLRKGG